MTLPATSRTEGFSAPGLGLERRVDVALPQVRRLDDVHVRIQELEPILRHRRLPARSLPQARARFHPQQGAAADGVPLGEERHGLADDVEVAPALGEAALAAERRATAVAV